MLVAEASVCCTVASVLLDWYVCLCTVEGSRPLSSKQQEKPFTPHPRLSVLSGWRNAWSGNVETGVGQISRNTCVTWHIADQFAFNYLQLESIMQLQMKKEQPANLDSYIKCKPGNWHHHNLDFKHKTPTGKMKMIEFLKSERGLYWYKIQAMQFISEMFCVVFILTMPVSQTSDTVPYITAWQLHKWRYNKTGTCWKAAKLNASWRGKMLRENHSSK